ncbi:sulfite exporter TauE/SafE family protein [Breoghania sp. L-A4]|nr:sulfite exporter TauE/SafE family protein [Breoghania sp. L-A4]
MPDFSDPAVLTILVAAMIGGAVRGFAGFGAAMIFMPVASIVIDPKIAAAAFLVMDDVLTMPMALRAARICDWRTVLPAFVGALLTVPLGALMLANADQLTMRWGISILVLALLGLLISGWRYKGAPTLPVSLGVGATSGFLSGVSQVAGPPVVAFWMSGPQPAIIIRANLIVYFALASFGALAAYWWNGLFTLDVAKTLVIIMPVNALALYCGSHFFSRSSERLFRLVAYGMVAIAAIGSLPVLDGVLR